jgi:hypothetical protein
VPFLGFGWVLNHEKGRLSPFWFFLFKPFANLRLKAEASMMRIARKHHGLGAATWLELEPISEAHLDPARATTAFDAFGFGLERLGTSFICTHHLLSAKHGVGI